MFFPVSKMLITATAISMSLSVAARAQNVDVIDCADISANDVRDNGLIVCRDTTLVSKKNPFGLWAVESSRAKQGIFKKKAKWWNAGRAATQADLDAAGINIDISGGYKKKTTVTNEPATGGNTGGTSTTSTTGTTCTTTTTCRPAPINENENLDNRPVIQTTTTTTTTTPTRRYRDPRAQAQYEFDELFAFCDPNNGYIVDAIESCGQNLDDKKAELQTADDGLKTLKDDEDRKLAAALAGCRSECIGAAINPTGAGLAPECGLKARDLANVLDWSDLTKQANDDLNTIDRKRALGKFLDDSVQTDDNRAELMEFIKGRNQKDNQGGVCKALFDARKNDKCYRSIMAQNPPSLNKCETFDDYIVARKAYDDAVKKRNVIAGAVNSLKRVGSACTIKSANDVAALKTSAGCDCLQRASSSCPRALADANAQLQVILRTPYCATCGYDGGTGNGPCAYGAGCGVSKAAQMISAIGGVAVPLGLGIMNLAMWNKGVNACTSMYAQSLDVSRVVGLPPPAPSCGGMGGLGMGFGGMAGMGGMMGPMGMGGLYGGMGMPGMMGMNPMMGGGIYGGINAGIGIGGYNPFMMGGGINAGLYGGMNPIMGGMNPMMGGGIYGGMNPMMGGMNPMMMGGMNPMMNMYGAQNQMMESYQRMQQMQAQNAVLQQSAMMGGMYGQMGGMYGMQMSPYYNMGYPNGMNPMMNMGVTGNFTMNPWAYAGGYNPMMYGGAGAGIQGGISAGISAGFNTGFNGGAYGGYNPMAYGGYNSPYSGYNNYGYNAGYGPYGNTGYYPSASSMGCGWQFGTPCM